MGEEITKATQEMNDNIATLTTDVTSLKTNASNVSQLALDYTGFKNELQSTLENVITYINSQNTSNTKTQSEIEEKLTAYKKLLVDYKSKITELKKGDIDALSKEIDLIKKRLTEEPALKIKRTELLQKATQLLNKTNNSGPQPPYMPPTKEELLARQRAAAADNNTQQAKQSQIAAVNKSQQEAKAIYNKKLNEHIRAMPSGTAKALDLAIKQTTNRPASWIKADFIDEGQKIAQDGRTKGGSSKTRRKPKKVRKSKNSRKTRRR